MELCQLEAKGQKYTWMNRRDDETFVMKRLDRPFAYLEWINSYPHYALRNQPILRSYHDSIILDFETCYKVTTTTTKIKLSPSLGKIMKIFSHMCGSHTYGSHLQ